jgi:hypothetical protein
MLFCHAGLFCPIKTRRGGPGKIIAGKEDPLGGRPPVQTWQAAPVAAIPKKYQEIGI